MLLENVWKKNWRVYLFRYAPVLFWVGVIFFLSSGSGSMNETSKFLGPLLQFIFPTASDESIVSFHGYIRKAAHVTEYAILAMLVWRAIPVANARSRKKVVFSILVVAIVACLDEFNQSFNVLRTSSPLDVLLDVFGATCAVICMYLWRRPRLGTSVKLSHLLF